MAIDFPVATSNGQTFSSGGRTWVWYNNYQVWKSVGTSLGYNFSTGNTVPSNPNIGDRWYQSDYGIELIYLPDPNGTSNQWVDMSTGGQTGATGYTGSSAASQIGLGNSQFFTALGSSNTITLSSNLVNSSDAVVSVNGLILSPTTHYFYTNIGGTPTITFTTAPIAGDIIEVRTFVGAVGFTGSAGPAGGYTGSQGAQGAVGYTGSAGISLAPTQTILTTVGSGTYTTPANAKWLRVRMIGGGGGGGGSGSSGATTGGNGSNTIFGTSFLTCTGGGGGGVGTGSFSGFGTGGTATGGDINAQGAYAPEQSASNATGAGNLTNTYGQVGASTIFGSGGYAGTNGGGSGGAAQTNSGAGGGSAGGGSGVYSGQAGAAGGYLEKIISSPAASYSYTVGSGGTAGTAGTSGGAGGAGGSGIIIIEEHYNY